MVILSIRTTEMAGLRLRFGLNFVTVRAQPFRRPQSANLWAITSGKGVIGDENVYDLARLALLAFLRLRA
jgi:hypothetical protein